ncbi:MAG: acyl-CoA dehydrogenase family protein [Chloroflexota bacterium]
MDFTFTEDQEKLRQEARDFLEGEIKQGLWEPRCDAWIEDYNPEFTKRVAQQGWLGLTWPKEYGGQGRSHVDRLIVTEEMLRYGAPAGCHWFADRQIGGSVLKYGTEEQKKEILPQILSGEMYVGLGMSEPETGSDLASIQTKAVEDGDDFIVNGQKTWTSGGSVINYIYLLARTDQEAPKHRGISEFVLPLDLPGISRSPLIEVTGKEAWNDVFFDDVRVPKKWLIGTQNKGFYQVMEQLAFERGGMERLMGNYPLFSELIKFVNETEYNGKPLSQDPIIRSKVAQLQSEFEVGRLFMYKVAMVMDKGGAPTVEAAMSKAYGTSFEQRLANTAVEILGPYGLLWADSKYVPLRGLATHSYLGSKGYSLQAGSTEVLKGIIAGRGLGLASS